MDFFPLLQALILGVVEGLTEFLPISSTGHLILAGALLDFNDERGKLFEIVIQSGAICAVCMVYRVRLAHTLSSWHHDAQARRLLRNVAIAFLPAAVLGLLFGHAIKMHLFHPLAVATAFVVGGVAILWAERRTHSQHIDSVDDLRAVDALILGLFQALALIPGTSRSGATIIGALLYGLSRRAATEFSFFLAIPTLFAATAYELFEQRALLHSADLGLWLVGFFAAFVSATICVRWLLRYIGSHDFTLFAWYRIGFGLLVLVSWRAGWVAWSGA